MVLWTPIICMQSSFSTSIYMPKLTASNKLTVILGRILLLYHFKWNESPQMQQHGWANIELEAVHLVEEYCHTRLT